MLSLFVIKRSIYTYGYMIFFSLIKPIRYLSYKKSKSERILYTSS
jgi:hypothetical protein